MSSLSNVIESAWENRGDLIPLTSTQRPPRQSNTASTAWTRVNCASLSLKTVIGLLTSG